MQCHQFLPNLGTRGLKQFDILIPNFGKDRSSCDESCFQLTRVILPDSTTLLRAQSFEIYMNISNYKWFQTHFLTISVLHNDDVIITYYHDVTLTIT